MSTNKVICGATIVNEGKTFVGDVFVKNDIIDNIDINKRNGSDKEYLFDELLYKCRFVIERFNIWLDAFKAILVRFETNKVHWKALNILAFIVILLRKL